MSQTANQILETLLSHKDIGENSAYNLMTELAEGVVAPPLAGALLTALRLKGESAGEVRGFARAMRDVAIPVSLDPEQATIDIVGTGGDGSNSFNLSTGTALLSAAAGLKVAKHGNRSVSSKSGSADVLEALGITLAADAAAVIDLLNKHNFAFLFAPFFHPAMKNIAPVRQALGIRTVFNILGPLTNPAQPTHYLLGAFSSEMAKLMAGALSGMNIERAFVIHGCNGWDEPTPVCPFEMYDVTANSIQFTTRDPQEFGIPKCSGEDLRGGTAEHNAKSLLNVFENKDQGAHRDALMLGTALALELAGDATDIEQGVQQAKETIETGTAVEFIRNLMQPD